MRINPGHPALKFLGFAASVILLTGAFLDALCNSISLITPGITYIFSSLLVVGAAVCHLLLKRRPLTGVGEDGASRQYRGMPLSSSAALLGIAVILWIPRLVSTPANSALRTRLTGTSISYSSEPQTPDLLTSLRAHVDGQSYELIDVSEELCLRVVDQKDFDDNGSLDVLVANVSGCGGNCCGDSYFFYAYLGDGHFQRTEEFGYSWSEPVVEKWKGRWSVVVTSRNEGMSRNAPEEVRERFVLDAGRAVKVEESSRRNLVAIVEMRVSEEADGGGISYDLDGDGMKDQITAWIWERWGRYSWSVKFSRGTQYASSVSCKRIGVLATKTNGINDLVCDHDDVMKWDGSGYMSQQ